METGQHPDVMQIILTRARSYIIRGKYPQVAVFSNSVMDLDRLKRAFRGHTYKHKNGYLWILSLRRDVEALIEQMGDRESETGFEIPIKEVLYESTETL